MKMRLEFKKIRADNLLVDCAEKENLGSGSVGTHGGVSCLGERGAAVQGGLDGVLEKTASGKPAP